VSFLDIESERAFLFCCLNFVNGVSLIWLLSLRVIKVSKHVGFSMSITDVSSMLTLYDANILSSRF
jgi:hypothetical protein